jgi:drug/metabolite transporter (DMT)-like permease
VRSWPGHAAGFGLARRRELIPLAAERSTAAWLNGLAGILIFSGSLPATRVAVADIDPVFLTALRALIAAALAGCVLFIGREKRPARSDLAGLAAVALGVVVGFPLLTALALGSITAAHATVYIGLLPLTTAVFGVARGGERPSLAFWGFAVLGSTIVSGYSLLQTSSAAGIGDILMLMAIAVCGLGYAEGARISRRLGGWQVISWALLLSAPAMLPLAAVSAEPLSDAGFPALAGLAYVSVFSMFVGFVFWYRGLALGGIAAIGQLQLLQPFLGLLLAGLLLSEEISLAMLACTSAVVLCVAGARRFAPR